MEISPRRPSKRALEPIDEWLQNEGFYRKHAPKDSTCLFRAISEQIYQTQRFHFRVRRECVDFMRSNSHLFEEKVKIPLNEYLEQMSCVGEYGGSNEVLAVSLMYKRNVVIFHGQKLTREATTNYDFNDILYLCFTPPKQYETVYTQDFTANAAFCQSLVYQTLYKDVFKMNDVDNTVHRMLHDHNSHLRHDKFFLKGNLEMREQLAVELLDKLDGGCNESEEMQLLSRGITPFPYRVAKALDPNIYRNVDFDIWHEIKREVRNSGWMKYNSMELQVGSKCLVQLEIKEEELDKANNNSFSKENGDSKTVAKTKRSESLCYSGHIQEMNKCEGPVVVFIEELGEKRTVPFSALKPFPHRKGRPTGWGMPGNRRNSLFHHNGKWKRPWGSMPRRPKEHTVNSNGNSVNTNSSEEQTPKNNSKVTKSSANDTEWKSEAVVAEKEPEKLQDENVSSKDSNITASVDSASTALENIEISSNEIDVQVQTEKSPKNLSSVNNEAVNNTQKKLQSNNHANNNANSTQNKMPIRRPDDVFYPPHHGNYPENAYPSVGVSCYIGNPEDLGASEQVDPNGVPFNYAVVKAMDGNSNDLPYSDPNTLRHFYNLGLKYYWSQNMWNDQSLPGNPCYMMMPANVDVNGSSNAMPGMIPNGEIANQGNNGNNVGINNNASGYNSRQNRSPPTRRKDDYSNSGAGRGNAGQKYPRNPDVRFSSPHNAQNSNAALEPFRNGADFNKGSGFVNYERGNEHSPTMKEAPRGGKNCSAPPRFKRNYENRNRNFNSQNGMSMPPPQQQQHQQQMYRGPHQHSSDNDFRYNKPNADAKQGQGNEIKENGLIVHPNTSQQQIPPPMSYPVSYNQPMPFPQPGFFPGDAEGYTAPPYYAPNPGFFPFPYMAAPEMSDGNMIPFIPPVYPGMENMAPQFSPVFAPYIYPAPPPPQVYQGVSQTNIPENCYPPYPGQPLFIPYPPMTTANCGPSVVQN